MKIRLMIAGVAVVGLGLAGCSSDSDSDASPSASSPNAQACASLDGITGQVESLATDDGSLTAADATIVIAQIKTGFEEVQNTATDLSDKTANKMTTALSQYTTDIGKLSSDAPVSDAASTSPSPSPAFSRIQADLSKAYAQVQAELGC
jgi:hypothetical protein